MDVETINISGNDHINNYASTYVLSVFHIL